ncbi:MAG TPA: WhiB family transcriptional regulator [Acidimicrobiales bacterium]|nr:WhiB family transcriptional regulator [Acidimicrobiales bacterium]
MAFFTSQAQAVATQVEGPQLELVADLPLDGDVAPFGPMNWRSEAACRQLPTELFFPVGHGPRAQAQVRLAKQVCAECAVQEDCLAYALAANTRYGVFGGLDEDERRELRRQIAASFGRRADAEDLEESA